MIFFLRSVFLLIFVSGMGFFFKKPLWIFLGTNPYFNGFIFFVWLGAVSCFFYEFIRILGEESSLKKGSVRFENSFLLPIVHCVKAGNLSYERLNDLISNCRKNLRGRSQFGRYIGQSLIFLGLLGTLWGLSETISQIAQVIGHLPTSGTEDDFFILMKTQLQKPLAAMGMAFSSSLFSLSGSVLLSFIDLQLSKAYESFCLKAKEWAQGFIQDSGIPGMPSGTTQPDVLNALLTQWIEGLSKLQRTQAGYEKRQQDLLAVLIGLSEKTNLLSDLMKAQHTLLNKWVDEQTHTRRVFEGLAQKMHDLSSSGDEVVKGYLNQISVNTRELLKRFSSDQNEVADVIRQEVKVLGQILGRRA